MRKPPRSIWLCLLGLVLLSGCDVAYPNHEMGDPAVSHGNTGNAFDLIGVHSQIACYSCHTPGTFEPLSDPVDANDCVACHQSDYDGEHSGSGYPTTCSSCHTPTVWSDGSLDHATVSGGFELLGTHTGKPCTACHDAATFEPLFDPVDANDCVACHQSDYDGEHSGSGYPTTCSSCHTPTVWSDGSLDHATVSGGFELLGTHTSKPCTACHDANTFEPLFDPADANDCVACHQSDYDGEHSGSGYPTSCSDCHTPTVWSDGSLDHATVSGGFELLGTHTSKPCTACHDANTFEPLFNPVDAIDCVACHQSDYDGEHSGSGYPTSCSSCHTPTVWSDGSLDHATVSGGFELLGTHTSKPCTACHDANTFEPLFNPVDAIDCVACHQSDYDGEHSGSGYPTSCSSCHTPTVWSDGSLDHVTVSGGFELLGTHTSKPCTACHDATTFEPLFDPVDASDCVTCHQADYDGEHSGSGYPTSCSSCHTPTVWSDGSLDHATVSGGFELLGTHTSKPCTACHDANTFEPLFDPVDASDCVACHQPDYDGQHSGSGYPTSCSDCHTPTVWSDGSLDHATVSGGFELLGTHSSKPCTACHDATTFEPLFNPVDASDCVACHQSDYDGEHSGSGYPTTCTTCHTPTSWGDGSFNHTTISGGFELLGTHTSKACTDCHDATTFAPLFDPVDASDCVACHQSDYDGEHSGSGYPTTCTTCHTPTSWGDGSFNHTTISGGFELWGPHVNKRCTVCHDAITFEPRFNPADDQDCEGCH